MGNCLTKFCCVRTSYSGRRDDEGREENICQLTNFEEIPDEQTKNKPLNQARKKKLEAIFQHIISNAAVDFTSPEIQDIQDAIHALFERIRTRVNNRGVFKITRVVPTGSMAEKTAIWKYDDDERETYLRFDNIAVLKESIRQCEDYSDYQRCPGCIRISNPPITLNKISKCWNDKMHLFKADGAPNILIKDMFLHEVNNCLKSSCHCLTLHTEEMSYSYRPSSVDNKYGCDMCTVDMPTGTLSVNINKAVIKFSHRPNNCSLILQWNSKTKKLLAPDKLLQQKQPIVSLPIYTNFIPAMESVKPSTAGKEHEYCIGLRRCNVCFRLDNRWRKLWCIAEIQAFKTEISDKHRRCYQIIKYLAMHSRSIFVNKDLIKNVVLQHSTTCSDTTYAYAECVIEVYQGILHAYNMGVFSLYHSNIDIPSDANRYHLKMAENYYQDFLRQLYSVSTTDKFDIFVTKLLESSESAAFN